MGSFLFTDESSNEDGENVEETFTEYVGIALSDSEEVTADTDLLSPSKASVSEDSADNGHIPSPKPAKTGCRTMSKLIQDTILDPVVKFADTSADSGKLVIFNCDSEGVNEAGAVDVDKEDKTWVEDMDVN